MDADKKRATSRWQAVPEDLVRAFGEAVRSLPGVEVRKMFGCPCALVGGRMLAGVHAQGLFLRLPPEDREAAATRYGAVPFEPMPGRPSRGYVVVPSALLDRPEEIAPWLAKSLAYTSSLTAKAARKPVKTGKGA